MQGQRIEYPDGDGNWPPANGSYFKGKTGDWFAMTPNGMYGNLSAHKVTEHDDGTITVSPSILVTGHDGSYHGYLEHGVWREC